MTKKFEVWLDSGANIHSCRKQVVSLDEIGYSEEEWDEMDDEQKDEVMREIAFQNSEWGWTES